MNPDWKEILKERLQLYGHRNWLVIADSAYPAQSRPGIETIVADVEQTTALVKTLSILDECRHIRPTIYTDEELGFVSEQDAPGATAYREELGSLLKGYEVRALQHDEIISKLDRIGEMFRVLLIKTSTRIPYTSVFFELQCGYWSAEAEDRLRTAMRDRDRNAVLTIAEGATRSPQERMKI